MPLRTVLSASQRAGFETLPTKSCDHVTYYLLSDEDLTIGASALSRGESPRFCAANLPGPVLDCTRFQVPAAPGDQLPLF